MALPDFSAARGTREQAAAADALQQCMQSAYANLRGGGGGRFGRAGSRKAFQDALSLCRSLTQRAGANATPTMRAPLVACVVAALALAGSRGGRARSRMPTTGRSPRS